MTNKLVYLIFSDVSPFRFANGVDTFHYF